jgi:tetratricopeptide (TPR) repeat protein
MKKQLVALSLSLMTMSAFAQKDELKTAEKAIKKQDFTTAIYSINQAEALLGSMDEKLTAKFYFLKGEAFAGKKDYKVAADALNDLLAYEEKIGRERYSDDAKPLMQTMIADVSKNALKLYNDDKDYKNAAENFYLTYLLSPTDTSYLFNAAISASLAKEFDSSLSFYKELKDIGYTGIATIYAATNKETGEVENLGSKSQRDLMVKSGQYLKPEDQNSESKRADIIKSIGYILTQQGKTDEAILAIKEARKSDPKDLNLLLTEADLYIKLDKMDKFGELMEQAIALDPTNPNLFFNLGVVNFNEKKAAKAVEYYKKAIELKPDYGDAYTNLAIVILDGERAIVEEMNKNLSDFDAYDKLLLKQKELYKEALPYLEKADSISRSVDTIKTLMNLYQQLAMTEKAKEYKALYEEFSNE